MLKSAPKPNPKEIQRAGNSLSTNFWDKPDNIPIRITPRNTPIIRSVIINNSPNQKKFHIAVIE